MKLEFSEKEIKDGLVNGGDATEISQYLIKIKRKQPKLLKAVMYLLSCCWEYDKKKKAGFVLKGKGRKRTKELK